MLLSRKKTKTDTAADATQEISSQVTRAYKQWHEYLVLSLRLHLSSSYVPLHTTSLVGLQTCIFAKSSLRPQITDVTINTVKRGMGGMYGNKGAILARCCVGDTSFGFVNCHLAAGEGAGDRRARGSDLEGILLGKPDSGGHSHAKGANGVEEGKVGVWTRGESGIAYVGGSDGSAVEDCEVCFVSYSITALRTEPELGY